MSNQKNQQETKTKTTATTTKQEEEVAVVSNSTSSSSTSRTALLNWLFLFRTECKIFHGLLRGGMRDNALHQTVFHKESMRCCRMLGLWYAKYKSAIIRHYVADQKRIKNRKRRLKRRCKKKYFSKEKDDNNNNTNSGNKKKKSGAEEESEEDLKVQKLKKKNKENEKEQKQEQEQQVQNDDDDDDEKDFKLKRIPTKTKRSFRRLEVPISIHETRLRNRVLLSLVRSGWSALSELNLTRRNTAPVALGILGATSRLHFLLSNSSSSSNSSNDNNEHLENEQNNNNGNSNSGESSDGMFARWLE